MLEIHGLSKRFGGLSALADVSFNVRKGEIVSLIGPNGAGKTTCLNLITGFYGPTSGNVVYRNADITGQPPYAIAQAGLGRRAIATGLEARLGVTRTAQTLRRLRARYPRIAFVWLMGADNLADISRWWRWTGIFRAARVAVFDRSPYSYKALAGCAAHRFSRARHPAKCLWPHTPPAWSYIAMRRHPASATALRLAAKAKRTKP